jgi:sugar-specific transcriptional regulator TrmB
MTSEDLGGAFTQVNQRFDLNDYETDAYLAVLEHGRLTASEIAERTDIPQPRVYDTVRSLEERGLVELRESRPITVLAIDPEEAFDDIHTSLDALVSDLKTHYTTPARDAEATSLVKSRSTILRYLETTIEEAEYELILSLTPDLMGRFDGLLAARQNATVTTELLLTPATDAPAADEYDYSTVATAVRARATDSRHPSSPWPTVFMLCMPHRTRSRPTASTTASSSIAPNSDFCCRDFSIRCSGRRPSRFSKTATAGRSPAGTPRFGAVWPTSWPLRNSSMPRSRAGTPTPASACR